MNASIMLALTLAASLPSIGQDPAGAETGFAPLLATRDSLQDWQSEHLRPNAASVENGSLRLAAGPGWFYTRKSFADFVLRFDVRRRTDLPAFTILLRGISDLDKPTPTLAYGIRLDGQHGSAVLYEKQKREFPFTRQNLAETLKSLDDWQQIEVACTGRACRLAVNGTEVATLTNLQVPFGSIGFSAEDNIELRNLRVRRTSPISEGFAKGAYIIGDDDLKPPRLRREAKPSYTAQALAAKIQGAVLLAALVNVDGSVGDIALLRSLDSQFGLDDEARVAAKQWRFEPATLRGQPVPTLVTIELTFTLRDRP